MIESAKYEKLCDKIDALFENQNSIEFKNCLNRLEKYVENGSMDATEYLADLLTYEGVHHDAVRAYKLYFIALSSQGYLTDFKDENNTPPHYCGPVGDFRNESMVSSLVIELGFDKIRELDSEIKQELIGKDT